MLTNKCHQVLFYVKAEAPGAGVCGWRAGEERGAQAETHTEEDFGRSEEEAANRSSESEQRGERQRAAQRLRLYSRGGSCQEQTPGEHTEEGENFQTTSTCRIDKSICNKNKTYS